MLGLCGFLKGCAQKSNGLKRCFFTVRRLEWRRPFGGRKRAKKFCNPIWRDCKISADTQTVFREKPRACLKIEEVPEFLFQRERFQGGNRKKYCRISRISNTENRPFGAKRRCLQFFKQALVFMRVPGFFHILAYRKAGPFWVLRVLKTYTRAENFEAGRKTRPASSCCPCQIDIPPTTR